MPHTEVVVIRDGDVILRREIASPIHPGRGSVMADAAATTIATRRSFAEALQLKEHGDKLRSVVTGTTGKAKSLLSGLWSKVTSSAAYTWAKGLLASAWSFASRQASKLGRSGMIAAALSVLTSQRGQRYIGKTVGFAGRMVDGAVRGMIKVVSWIPFIGKPVAERLNTARHWAWNKVLDLTLAAGESPIVQAFHHEGIVSRNVRRFAAPLTMWFGISRLVPGYWKIPAYAAFILWGAYKLMDSPKVGTIAQSVVSFREGFKDGRTEQAAEKIAAARAKVDLSKPVSKGAMEFYEKVGKSVTEAPSTTEAPEGPALAGNATHVAADVAEDLKVEAAQERAKQNGEAELIQTQAKRFVSSELIATLTAGFFADDRTYKTPGACKAALKGLVLPEFKTVMGSKAGNIAAGKFCDRMIEVHQGVTAGDQEYDDYAQDSDSPILLDHLQLDAMNAMQATREIPRVARTESVTS